jgi:hypothetical protein
MQWQECKKETCRINSIFETEPLKDAMEMFKKEYIAKLKTRCEDDKDEAIRRSGMKRDEFEKY